MTILQKPGLVERELSTVVMPMDKQKIDEAKRKIVELYKITDQLRAIFPHKPFTPDGHLVGNLGEVLAAYYYGLTLVDSAIRSSFDALSEDGKQVQIKATQREGTIGMRSQSQWLLVILIHRNADIEEIYNGPGEIPWNAIAFKQTSNGQKQISVAHLRKLQGQVGSIKIARFH